MKFKLIITLIFIGVAMKIPNNCFAQTLSVGIYPPIIQVQAEPPASVTSNINIENQTDQTTTYSITLMPFRASETENGQPVFDKTLLPAYKSIFSKTQIMDGTHNITQVTLAPKQKKTLVMHMGIPKGEKAADYYFSILFISQAGDNINNSFTGARAGIGTNVLLSVGPKPTFEGAISRFEAPGFLTKGPVSLNLALTNTGSSYFAPTGNVVIKDMFGQSVGSLDLLPVNVLSDSTRLIPSKDNADPNNPAVIWNQKFLLGFYSAKATISLSEQGPVITKTISFFAFPVEGILGIIILIILVVGIVRRVKAKAQNTY